MHSESSPALDFLGKDPTETPTPTPTPTYAILPKAYLAGRSHRRARQLPLRAWRALSLQIPGNTHPNADPDELEIWMQMETVFKPKAERTGSILDIEYFRPMKC